MSAQIASLDAAISGSISSLTAQQTDELHMLRERLDLVLTGSDTTKTPTILTATEEGWNALVNEVGFPLAAKAALLPSITAITGFAPTLSSLSGKIESLLGLSPGSLTLETADVNDSPSITEQAIIAHIHLNKTLAPTDFPLNVKLDGGSIPVSLDSSGKVTVSASADLQLDFGVNLSTGSPFLLDTTAATVTGGAQSTSLAITAQLGGITGAQLGTAGDPDLLYLKRRETETMTASGGASFPLPTTIPSSQQVRAAIVSIDDVVQDGHYTLTSTNLTFDSAPGSGATVNVYYPGTSDASIALTLNDSSPDSHGVIPFSEITGSTFDFTIDGMVNAVMPVYLPLSPTHPGDFRVFADLNNLGGIYLGTPSGMSGDLAAQDCDLMGLVSGLNTFLGVLKAGLQSDVLAKLPLIGDAVDLSGTIVGKLQGLTSGLSTALGAGEAAIKQFLYDNLGPGDGPGPGLDLNVLVDPDTGTPITNVSDVAVTIGGAECLSINLRLKGSDSITVPFDLGLSAINFGISGSVVLGLNYDVRLGMGLNKTEGFYLKLNPDPSVPEIQFGLSATVPGVTAKLFFLDVTASESASHPETTGIIGTLKLNVNDPNSDGKLTIPELTSTPFTSLITASLSGDAIVDMDLLAGVGSPDLPKMGASLYIKWHFLDGEGLTGEQPIVQLNNVYLYLGDFMTNLLQPILGPAKGLQKYLQPLQPIFDFLQSKIPVVSDLSEFVGNGPITVQWLIDHFGSGLSSVTDFIDMLGKVKGIVDAAVSLSTGRIEFGSFNLSSDARTSTPIAAGDSDITPDSAGSPESQASGLGGAIGGILTNLNSIGLHLPVLEHPSTLFNLFFGKRVQPGDLGRAQTRGVLQLREALRAAADSRAVRQNLRLVQRGGGPGAGV